MTAKLADRVKETTTTTGTGTIDLAGAVSGFQTFVAGIGTGNTCYYAIVGGAEWEVGIGTVTDATPDTLSRTTVLASSNSGSLVTFSAGTKDVFCTMAAAAGGRTLIAVLPGTGASATIDFTSIPGIYNVLTLYAVMRDTKTSTAQFPGLKINNDGTAGNYLGGPQYTGGLSGSVTASTVGVTSGGMFFPSIPGASSTASFMAFGTFRIVGYASANWKRVEYQGENYDTAQTQIVASALWKSTAAITRLTLTTDGTAFTTDSIFYLYGE